MSDDFDVGAIMYDTNGDRIRAHQPHIVLINETYMWYGAAQVGSSDGTAGDVNLYTSSDLVNWSFYGVVYSAPSGYVERVSMLGIDPESGLYVMYAKGASFQSATAASPYGPFDFVANSKPPDGESAGDSQTYRDDLGGEAYEVYSQKPNGTTGAVREIRVALLNASSGLTTVAASPVIATVAPSLEAPVTFYSDVTQLYYVWGSHCSGWTPNAAVLSAAPAMAGPWKSLGNPSANSTTFGTQGSHILPLPGAVGVGGSGVSVSGAQRFLYMGDRYEPFIGTDEGSRYIFLPMEVAPDGTVTLAYPPSGHWSPAEWPSELFP